MQLVPSPVAPISTRLLLPGVFALTVACMRRASFLLFLARLLLAGGQPAWQPRGRRSETALKKTCTIRLSSDSPRLSKRVHWHVSERSEQNARLCLEFGRTGREASTPEMNQSLAESGRFLEDGQ